jgi:hypothetical protein
MMTFPVFLKCLTDKYGCKLNRGREIIMYRYLLLVCLLFGSCLIAAAQNPDTGYIRPKVKNDSLKATRYDTLVTRSFKPKKAERIYHPDSTHSPHKAVIRSLIVPGWGQVYNHRIWKVPLVYGGLGLFGWGIVFNANYYNEFYALSKYRENGTTPGTKDPYYKEFKQYTNQQNQAIYDAADAYRRNRDLCILGALGFWGINAIDAYIDAKFIHSYTVDNNLSIKIRPDLINQPIYAQNGLGPYIPGIKITFAF